MLIFINLSSTNNSYIRPQGEICIKLQHTEGPKKYQFQVTLLKRFHLSKMMYTYLVKQKKQTKIIELYKVYIKDKILKITLYLSSLHSDYGHDRLYVHYEVIGVT